MVEHAPQLLDRDIAAAEDQADGLAGKLVAPGHSGDRRRAGALGDLGAVSRIRRMAAAISSSWTSTISSTRRGISRVIYSEPQ